MTNVIDFDPDELFLEKKDILRVIDAIKNRWEKGGIKNKLYMITLTGIRMSLSIVPDDILKLVWRDMIGVTNKLLQYNAMMRLKGEMPKTEGMLKIIENEINGDDFIGEPIKKND